ADRAETQQTNFDFFHGDYPAKCIRKRNGILLKRATRPAAVPTMLNRNLIPFLPDDVKNIHGGSPGGFHEIFLKNPAIINEFH
ncbi:MAG: hypothetical protein KKA71_01675, partial [Proteobacteria bacterium]|nr:hypothetical protein [Pseudomonadota bacterium]